MTTKNQTIAIISTCLGIGVGIFLINQKARHQKDKYADELLNKAKQLTGQSDHDLTGSWIEKPTTKHDDFSGGLYYMLADKTIIYSFTGSAKNGKMLSFKSQTFLK